MSLIIFLFFWSADLFAMSSSSLIISKDVLTTSLFTLFLTISFSVNIGDGT